MNLIDVKSVNALAGALFDGELVPVAEARKKTDAPDYFATTPAASALSYFSAPSLAVMTAEDFEFPGDGSATGLVKALNTYWIKNGDSELSVLTPQLAVIAEMLREEDVAGDGSVDILCYTMF